MTTPIFQAAVYVLAPAFDGWHVRQPEADAHPLIPAQILLHEPLRPDPFGKIHTAANGRNPDRFVWWNLWYKTSLQGVYHAFEPTPNAQHLLVFHQPKRGHSKPFRLLVAEVTAEFPKEPTDLWPLVGKHLASLPPIPEPNTINTLAQ